MFSLRKKLIFWALYSRIIVIILQFFVKIALIQTDGIDSNNEEENVKDNNSHFEWVRLDHYGQDNLEEVTGTDVIFMLFGGLLPKIEKEVQHNVHIANHGYTYENNLLYFPLYPLMIKGLSNIWNWFGKDFFPWEYQDDSDHGHQTSSSSSISNSPPAVILLASIIINIPLFALAADRLYLLSRKVLKDEYLAYKAALFFCINPSSVLFTSPMTLSLLAASSFTALASIENGMGLFSGAYLAVASATHPSALLGLLMVLYNSMRQVATQTILLVKTRKKNSTTKNGNNKGGNNSSAATNAATNHDQLVTMLTNILTKAMIPGMWCIVASLLPFAAFQWFGFAVFCKLQKHELSKLPQSITSYGNKLNLTMPGDDLKPDWCHIDPPIPYFELAGDVIQWREAFSHWVPEDWPQYIAWTPALVLVIWQVCQFVKIHKKYCLRFGLVDNALLGMAKPRMQSWTVSRALPRDAFIYLVHAGLLILCSVFFASIQTICRVLVSCNPTLYWIAAVTTTPFYQDPVPIKDEDLSDIPTGKDGEKLAVVVENGKNLYSPISTLLLTENITSDLSSWTKIYFFGYLTMGTMIFASNFPGL